MKTPTLFFLMLFAGTSLIAQSFAPVGATWHYSERFAFSGAVDYIRFTAEMDTMVNNQLCSKITKRHKLLNGRPQTEFLFSRNDTVFFLDTTFNEFQILYDFNAGPGDSWDIKVVTWENEIDTFSIRVDSTSMVNINGTMLKAMHVSYLMFDGYLPETYNSTIIEKIGVITYMFNWNVIAPLVDANWTDGLRCYEDQDLGMYSTGIADSCEYTTLAIDDSEQTNIATKIFPNPNDGHFFLSGSFGIAEEKTLSVYNSMGQVILEKSLTSEPEIYVEIQLGEIAPGIYFIMVEGETENKVWKMLVR